MLKFFEYNWQVRDEWFEWCKQLSNEELLIDRTGGVGSILYTLFHIIDVEHSWLCGIQGKEDVLFQYADYKTIEKTRLLSDTLRDEIICFLKSNIDEIKEETVIVPWDKEPYTVDEILHHIIAHEIHHIGQLSVWARELSKSPVNANLIGRKIRSIKHY